MNSMILSSVLVSFLTTIIILFLFIDFIRLMIETMVKMEVLQKMGKTDETPRGFFKKKQKVEEKLNPTSFTDEQLYEREMESHETKRPLF
jgi:UPF0716 family protein affecting phage T7 exclusion